MIDKIEGILTIILGSTTILSVFISILTSLSKKSAKKKILNAAESAYKELEDTQKENTDLKSFTENIENNYKLLEEIIPQAIEKAEQSGLVNGVLKKTYALSLIMLECAKLNMDWSECGSKVETLLEGLIDFSKKVNCKNN